VLDDAFDTWFWQTGVAKVQLRLHFVDYLVHGREVVYRSEMDVVWTYTSAKPATPPPRTNTAGPASAVTKMDAPHYQALVRRFPTWRYFGHD
jgi:hypothetical protein